MVFYRDKLITFMSFGFHFTEFSHHTAFYERLTGLGLNTSKENFEQIYDEMKGDR